DSALALLERELQPLRPSAGVVPVAGLLVLADGVGGVVGNGGHPLALVHAHGAGPHERAFLQRHRAVCFLQHVLGRKTKAADARGLHFGAHLSAVPANLSHRPSPSNAMSTRYVASCPTPASAGRRSPRSPARP